MFDILVIVIALFLQVLRTSAQFPPTPENITVLESRFGDGVSISYKEVLEIHFMRDRDKFTDGKEQDACL